MDVGSNPIGGSAPRGFDGFYVIEIAGNELIVAHALLVLMAAHIFRTDGVGVQILYGA